MKKVFAAVSWVAVLCMLALILSACGGEGATTTVTTTATTTTTTTAATTTMPSITIQTLPGVTITLPDRIEVTTGDTTTTEGVTAPTESTQSTTTTVVESTTKATTTATTTTATKKPTTTTKKPTTKKPTTKKPTTTTTSTTQKPTTTTTANTNQSDGVHNEVETEIFRLLNELRAEQGLPALALATQYHHLAEIRAEECTQLFSHTRPDGSSCFSVLGDDWGTKVFSAAENIAAGYPDAASVHLGWKNSPGHYSNMTSTRVNAVAIAVAYSESGYPYYCQFFVYVTD